MRPPGLTSTARSVAWHARHTPEATAIVEHNSPITYRALASDLVNRVRAIEALGVRPGMLAGVETGSRYQHLLVLLACEVIGAATTSLTPGQDDFITRRCDLILNCDPPADAPVHDLDVLDREIVPTRVARIVKTSGTTGRPKAMQLSFATQQLRIVRANDRLPPDILPAPRMLCLYGLGVGGIHMRVLSTLQLGGTVFFSMGEDACSLIASGAINHALFTAGDLERTLPHAEPPPAGHALHVLVFGAAFTPALRQQVRERLNASVANPYSAIETDPIAMMDDNNAGSLCPGVEVRIVDEAGQERPRGEAGIIRVRTDTMVQGYFNDEAMTNAAFINGWYQTSDVGIMPEPGKLIVLGRTDGMLNIGGVKVAPSPIEDRIKRIGDIKDAIVMSIAGPNGVGILVAAVEIGNRPPRLDPMQRVGAILSEYAGAFVIMPLPRFPRTDSGKIRRPDIEAAFRERPAHDLIAVG
jgi:O-succinylbenzoic acid--CoA ligase